MSDSTFLDPIRVALQTEMDRNGPKWTEMSRNGPKWAEMGNYFFTFPSCFLYLMVAYLDFCFSFVEMKDFICVSTEIT